MTWSNFFFTAITAIKLVCSTQLLSYSLWLAHANSAANPLLYCLFSRNIRQSLKNLFQVNGRNLRHSSELIPMTHNKRRTSVSKR